MDIHEKSTNLNMGLQSGILRKLWVCVRVGRSAPPVHTGLKGLDVCSYIWYTRYSFKSWSNVHVKAPLNFHHDISRNVHLNGQLNVH